MLIYTSSVLKAGALINLHQKIDLIPDFGGEIPVFRIDSEKFELCVFDDFHQRQPRKY